MTHTTSQADMVLVPRELLNAFEALVNQIDNTRIAYFGTHAGRSVQFSDDQIKRWRELLSRPASQNDVGEVETNRAQERADRHTEPRRLSGDLRSALSALATTTDRLIEAVDSELDCDNRSRSFGYRLNEARAALAQATRVVLRSPVVTEPSNEEAVVQSPSPSTGESANDRNGEG
jgi:hypothetical protein